MADKELVKPTQHPIMASRPVRTIDVTIQGRLFSIRTQDNPDHVRQAAEMVEERITELRRMGAAVASDRLLTLVALNLAGELLDSAENSHAEMQELLSSLDEVALLAKGLVTPQAN
ncbi:MAG: cell division protein ZapA [Mariprofundales bacterium]